MRKLGIWLFVGGFAVGLIGTVYAMARAFNRGEPVQDVSAYAQLATNLTFIGLGISSLGGLLFLVSALRRRRAVPRR